MTMAQRVTDPTPEDIQAAIKRIQAGWTARTEQNRRCCPIAPPVQAMNVIIKHDALGRVVSIYEAS